MENPLKDYREQNGLSQRDLADILGCSRGLVSLIETGERPITPENADTWAQLLGIPRSRLHPMFKRAA